MAQPVEQPSLFGCGAPDFDRAFRHLRHYPLAMGAWVDHLPGWVSGHERIFETLWTTTNWRLKRRHMYERVVDVPRLFAMLPEDGPGHPLLPVLGEALSARYGRALSEISLAGSRDGQDSVAFHGDRVGRERDDTVVAIVSFGAPRRFLLRPAGGAPHRSRDADVASTANGGSRSSRSFELGWGDLLVMGGTCQRTWEHGVPKTARAAPRLSVQFRPIPKEEDDARAEERRWKRAIKSTKRAPGGAAEGSSAA
jgi:alkylated DNA repair dioxygenase AlkB